VSGGERTELAVRLELLGVGVFRRFAMALGDRLVTKGVIDAADDVHYLTRDEVVDALTNGGDRRGLTAERRASMARASQVIPPGALGVMPPPPEVSDPFMEAIVFRLLGMVPPEGNNDPNALRGVSGSPGRYTGTARVVRSLAEASDLDEGDIMVCEMTLPPWAPLFSIAGAVVTDVGGVLSHSAIVARELDLPAVVGTQVGTVVIKNGQTITVDGTKGVVYLDGRAL
jgi:pyruvate,water dikinase